MHSVELKSVNSVVSNVILFRRDLSSNALTSPSDFADLHRLEFLYVPAVLYVVKWEC